MGYQERKRTVEVGYFLGVGIFLMSCSSLRQSCGVCVSEALIKTFVSFVGEFLPL